jgi:hypothetical protein
LRIENPFPSASDLFWLIGYAPFTYYILRSYKFFNSNNTLSKPVVLTVFISATILVASNIIATAFAYEFSTQQDIALFLISIAYPILDTVFVAPAGLIILNNLGIGQLTSIPWIFISMMITALADSIFGFSSSGGIANETSLIWNPIYVAGYSLMAAELYWYNRFFIYGKPNNLGGYHLVTPGIPEIGKAMDHDDRCLSFANRDVVYAYPVIVGIMMCHIFVDIVLGELGISYSAYIYVSFQSFTSFFL